MSPLIPYWQATKAFVRGYRLAGVAAENAHLQVYNPLTSGKVINIYGMLIGIAGSVEIIGTTYDTALTTLVGAGTCQYLGKPAGLGQLRQLSNASILGTETFSFSANTNSPPGGFIPLSILLDPGKGFVMVNRTQNSELVGTFFWLEF